MGDNKREFQVWVGQRFGRESFADAVHDRAYLSGARPRRDLGLDRHGGIRGK
ncbi:MAG: hypothetical protein F2836_05590 [Actinobacteria bacterium]|nr:hypothetical protein [Actinomycetota bacterium]